jgi:hypothetical protein
VTHEGRGARHTVITGRLEAGRFKAVAKDVGLPSHEFMLVRVPTQE